MSLRGKRSGFARRFVAQGVANGHAYELIDSRSQHANSQRGLQRSAAKHLVNLDVCKAHGPSSGVPPDFWGAHACHLPADVLPEVGSAFSGDFAACLFNQAKLGPRREDRQQVICHSHGFLP
jgi:hypothetical protein